MMYLLLGLLTLSVYAEDGKYTSTNNEPVCARAGPWRVYPNTAWKIGSYGGTQGKDWYRFLYMSFQDCLKYCETSNLGQCTLFDWKPALSGTDLRGECRIDNRLETYKTTFKAKGSLTAGNASGTYAYERVDDCNAPTHHPTDTPRPTPPPVPPTHQPTRGNSKAPTTEWKPTPEPTSKPTSSADAISSYGEGEDQDMYRKGTLGYNGDQRNLCDTYEQVHSKEHGIERAIAVINQCNYKGKVRSVVLKRPGDTWVFSTSKVDAAYADMLQFVRDQSDAIDAKHPVTFTYHAKSRDGKSREFTVNDNMSLHAAFLVEDEYEWVELTMVIGTVAPTKSPDTAMPTSTPTTPSPTSHVISNILTADDAKFLNDMLATKIPMVRLAQRACYTMTVEGKTNKSPSIWRTNCGNGKGPMVIVGKTDKGHVFGGFYDLNWTNSGGTWFKNQNAMLFTIKGREEKYNHVIQNRWRYLSYSTYHHTSYGPYMGNGCDFCITSFSNSGTGYATGTTRPGSSYTYQAPNHEDSTGSHKNGSSYYYIDSASSASFKFIEWESFPVVSSAYFDSRIITSRQDRKWLESLLPKGRVLGARCYGMRFGLGEQSHSTTSYWRNSCANKGPFVAIFQEEKYSHGKYIMGGYSGVDWSTSNRWDTDKDAFVWILKDRNVERFKAEQIANPTKAVYSYSSYGPCFGSQHDLCLSAPSSKRVDGQLGYTYAFPTEDKFGNTFKKPYYMAHSSTRYIYLHNWEVFLTKTEDERREWRGF